MKTHNNIVYFLRTLKINNGLKGEKLLKMFDTLLIKMAIKNKYVFYNKTEDKYLLTKLGEQEVRLFNTH